MHLDYIQPAHLLSNSPTFSSTSLSNPQRIHALSFVFKIHWVQLVMLLDHCLTLWTWFCADNIVRWVQESESLPCSEDSISQHCSHLLALPSVCPLPCRSLLLWWWGLLLWMSHLGLGTYSQHFDCLRVSALTVNHCREKRLWPRWRAALIYGCKHKCLEAIRQHDI